MKLAAICLIFAGALSAQVTSEDAIVNRLESALQAIGAEKGDQEISIVIAVQANNKIGPEMLRDFRRIGSMLEPLVSSGRGEVEVLSYGDRVGLLVAEPFTSDSAKAARGMAFLKISTGLQRSSSTILDAIAEATSDLETRAASRRKIVIVLGESSKDAESDQKLKDAIHRAADRLPNVVFVFPLVP